MTSETGALRPSNKITTNASYFTYLILSSDVNYLSHVS